MLRPVMNSSEDMQFMWTFRTGEPENLDLKYGTIVIKKVNIEQVKTGLKTHTDIVN